MERTPVAINQGWQWQAPGVPGLNSRKSDSCWLIRLTRPHENANYLRIVLLSCEDQSNIYPSAFQYSSIPSTWCTTVENQRLAEKENYGWTLGYVVGIEEKENMTDSRGDRLIMNQRSLSERNKMKCRNMMACCSSDHTSCKYVHVFHPTAFRREPIVVLIKFASAPYIFGHKWQAQPGYKAACLLWGCDLYGNGNKPSLCYRRWRRNPDGDVSLEAEGWIMWISFCLSYKGKNMKTCCLSCWWVPLILD